MSESNAPHQLKTLQRSRNEAMVELKEMNKQIEVLRQNMSILQKNINAIDKDIERLQDKQEIIVTEHAMLRYFERVCGYDLGEIQKKILSPEVQTAIDGFGSGLFPHEDGFKLRVKNGNVVTIETKEMKNANKPKRSSPREFRYESYSEPNRGCGSYSDLG